MLTKRSETSAPPMDAAPSFAVSFHSSAAEHHQNREGPVCSASGRAGLETLGGHAQTFPSEAPPQIMTFLSKPAMIDSFD